MPRATPEDLRRELQRCAEEGVTPLGSLLRELGTELPDDVRRAFSLADDRVAMGSTLGKWIEAGELPADTERLLNRALYLRDLRDSAWWRDLEEALEIAASVVAADWPAVNFLQAQIANARGLSARKIIEQKESPWLSAFEAVLHVVKTYRRGVEDAEGEIHEAGFQYNWGTGRLEIPPRPEGGRPRQLLRDLVEALHQAREMEAGGEKIRNTLELREWIAGELAAFFSSDVLDTSKGSPLYNAVETVCRNG